MACGVRSDEARAGLDVAEVRRLAGALPFRLRRRIDRDEDRVGRGDVGGALCLTDKPEIAPAGPGHDLGESGLIDRQVFGIPRGDPLRIEIKHRHVDVRAAVGDDGHGRAADIAGADAGDFTKGKGHGNQRGPRARK